MGCENSKAGSKEKQNRPLLNRTSKDYKLVLLGDVAVGKTSLLWRFVKSEFLDAHTPTVGLAYLQSTIELDDKQKVTLNLWDTGGQAYFRDLVSLYYRDAAAALLVFDRTNANSFESLKDWIQELENKVDIKTMVIGIVANKADLPNKVISKEQIDEVVTKYKLLYFETSARTGEGVGEVFKKIAEACHTKSQSLANKGRK